MLYLGWILNRYDNELLRNSPTKIHGPLLFGCCKAFGLYCSIYGTCCMFNMYANANTRTPILMFQRKSVMLYDRIHRNIMSDHLCCERGAFHFAKCIYKCTFFRALKVSSLARFLLFMWSVVFVSLLLAAMNYVDALDWCFSHFVVFQRTITIRTVISTETFSQPIIIKCVADAPFINQQRQ